MEEFSSYKTKKMSTLLKEPYFCGMQSGTLSDKLRCAAAEGDVFLVKDLLKSGISPRPDEAGRTALHFAAQHGNVYICYLLIQHGCRPDVQDFFGDTALHEASPQGHTDVIKLLVEENCNVNIQNKDGCTALHLSAKNGHNQSTRILLQAGCNTDLKDKLGNTALHYAAYFDHADVIRILFVGLCSLNDQNKDGNTALHMASERNHKQIAKLLMDVGIDITLKNKRGESTVDVAKRKQYPEIIKLFFSSKIYRIETIEDFKQFIVPCREIKIHRKKFDYHHHAFVGYVDIFRCDIYHYKPQIEEFFYGHFPGRVTCDKLFFAHYDTDGEIKKIFDFGKGDVVTIVDRSDYPKTHDEMAYFIERAKSRLGEAKYSLSGNNCESYVNWIFTNENTSRQFKKSGFGKRMLAGAIETSANEGIRKPAKHAISGVISEVANNEPQTLSQMKTLSKQSSPSNVRMQQVDPKYPEFSRPFPRHSTFSKQTMHSSSNMQHTSKPNHALKSSAHDIKVNKLPVPENVSKMSENLPLLRNSEGAKSCLKMNPADFDTKHVVYRSTNSAPPRSANAFFNRAMETIEKSRKPLNVTMKSTEPAFRSGAESVYKPAVSTVKSMPFQAVTRSSAKASIAKPAFRQVSYKASESAAQFSYKSFGEEPQFFARSASKLASKQNVFRTTTPVAKTTLKPMSTVMAYKTAKSTVRSVLKPVGNNIASSITRTPVRSAANLAGKSVRTVSATTVPAPKVVLKGAPKIIRVSKPSFASSASRTATNTTKNTKLPAGMTKGALAASVLLEGAFLTKRLYDIATDEDMDDEQKQRSATKEVSSSIVGVPAGICGAVLGQTLIPIPFVGAAIGGLIGGLVGNAAGGALGEGLFSIFN